MIRRSDCRYYKIRYISKRVSCLFLNSLGDQLFLFVYAKHSFLHDAYHTINEAFIFI